MITEYFVRYKRDAEDFSEIKFIYIGGGAQPTKKQFRNEILEIIDDLMLTTDVEQIKAIRNVMSKWGRDYIKKPYEEKVEYLRKEGMELKESINLITRYVIEYPSWDISQCLLYVALDMLDKNRWREYYVNSISRLVFARAEDSNNRFGLVTSAAEYRDE